MGKSDKSMVLNLFGCALCPNKEWLNRPKEVGESGGLRYVGETNLSVRGEYINIL